MAASFLVEGAPRAHRCARARRALMTFSIAIASSFGCLSAEDAPESEALAEPDEPGEVAAGDPGEGAEFGSLSQALTTGQVWHMENASAWTIVTGTGNKQASNIRNEGSSSLQLTSSAFVAVRGDGVDKPAAVSPLLGLDVMIPTQAGPFYLGAVQLSLTVPSLNIFNAWVGQRELSPPKGVWQTLHFQLPNDLYAQLLANSFNDLQVTIGLNPPSGLNQPYRLDHLRFVPMPGCAGVADGTLCDDLVSCTSGNTCSAGRCGTLSGPAGSLCDPGDDVLGFENFPAWQTSNGAAALAPSETRVQGARSLSITTANFMTVSSIPLATLHKVSRSLSLRVQKPTHQPNPGWHGDVTLNMKVPSLGINLSSTKQLTGQPSGSFFELLFDVPAATYQSLATSTYSDLSFSISVNPPNGQNGAYLLDDLHFVPVASCSGGVIDNTACDDSSRCTEGDACRSGTCGTTLVCNDANGCTNDSCNPATGCVFTNNTNPCTDGSACTTTDTCAGGLCIPGPALPCNDANGCTTDSCNPATGCVFTNNADPCTDGNACTSGDRCSGGSCASGPALSCDDGNGCTDDSCNPATGCVRVNNGAACSDGNACSGGDVCAAGACVSGPAISCDDGSNCTADACDPVAGCVSTFACASGSVCFNNACCMPKTCADVRAECGPQDDGCGNPLNCGTCPAGGTCNPAGRCLRPNSFDEPSGINVCEILLEELIIPPTFEDFFTCDDDACGFFHPDCCIPGVCLLDPFCTVLSRIEITPEEIYRAGDVYCRVTLTPAEYFERLVNGRLNDLTALGTFLTTGGLSSLFDFDVAVMTSAGREAPSHVRSLIRELTAPVYDGGATGFSYEDMDDAKIVSSAFPTAGLYLPGERLAITLGPVIVLKADLYDALVAGSNSGVTYSDFLTNPGVSTKYIEAVDTFIHELVHVKQYRELGRYNFYAQYLGQALANGYGGISFEEEAFRYEIELTILQGGRWCSVMAAQQNGQISGFGLPISPNPCPAP